VTRTRVRTDKNKKVYTEYTDNCPVIFDFRSQGRGVMAPWTSMTVHYFCAKRLRTMYHTVL